MINKYGGTYTNLANECIDEFVTHFMRHAEEQAKLRKDSTLFPKLKPIVDGCSVRDHLNVLNDNYSQKVGTSYSHKGPTDPPTPGYCGHIPKAIATNLALSCTYRKGAARSLSAFRTEILNHFARLKTPVDPLKK